MYYEGRGRCRDVSEDEGWLVEGWGLTRAASIEEEEYRNWIQLHINLQCKIVHKAIEGVLSALCISHLLVHFNAVVVGNNRRYRRHRWRAAASLTIGSDDYRLCSKNIDVAFVATTSNLKHQGVIPRDWCTSLYIEAFFIAFNSWILSTRKRIISDC